MHCRRRRLLSCVARLLTSEGDPKIPSAELASRAQHGLTQRTEGARLGPLLSMQTQKTGSTDVQLTMRRLCAHSQSFRLAIPNDESTARKIQLRQFSCRSEENHDLLAPRAGCRVCHRAWFYQICNRSDSAPDKYLLKCANVPVALEPGSNRYHEFRISTFSLMRNKIRKPLEVPAPSGKWSRVCPLSAELLQAYS